MLCRIAVLLVLALPAASCTDLAALDPGGDAAPPALSDAERGSVRAQVDKALAEQRFKTAWNQEVAAGADRGRLEAIALAALRGQSGHAADMFAALRTKHGALTPATRTRVDALAARARDDGGWSRALEIELMTADDAPAYARAWGVYRAAPPERAAALLESIQEAKAAHAAGESGD